MILLEYSTGMYGNITIDNDGPYRVKLGNIEAGKRVNRVEKLTNGIFTIRIFKEELYKDLTVMGRIDYVSARYAVDQSHADTIPPIYKSVKLSDYGIPVWGYGRIVSIDRELTFDDEPYVVYIEFEVAKDYEELPF